MVPTEPKNSNDQNQEIKASQVLMDGDLSSDRLDGYLARGMEEDELDFKDTFNWKSRTTKDKLEFVKDTVAMANTLGGYIIYGVREDSGADKRFSLRGLTDEESRYFDPFSLKDLIERYVRRRIVISCAVVESKTFPGEKYGAVFIRRFSSGFAIPFEADGQYAQKSNGKQQETVFSRGEIWVRRGAKSIRAQAEDIERLESDFRRREQTIWLAQHFQLSKLIEDVNELSKAMRQNTGNSPIEIEANVMEPRQELLLEPFHEMQERFLRVLQANNEILILRWLQMPKEKVLELARSSPEDTDEQQRLIDNVALPLLNSELTMAVVSIQFDQQKYFDVSVQMYCDIYQHFAYSKEGINVWLPVMVWRELILRMFILGATAVRYKRYSYLPNIIKQAPYGDDYWRRKSYWARHALTMMARADLLKPKSLCEMARQLAEQLGIIEPLFETDDWAKTHLAQFDFIQAITGVHRNGDLQDIYPNFGVYYNYRVAGLIRELFQSGAARSAIPNMNDQELRKIIKELDGLASREFSLSGWDPTDWPSDVKELIYA